MSDTVSIRNPQLAPEMAQRLWTTWEQDGAGGLEIASSALRTADLAESFDWLAVTQRNTIFQHFPSPLAAEVLEECSPEIRQDLLDALSNEQLVDLLRVAKSDDAVYFLDHLDDDHVDRLLQLLDDNLSALLSEQYELPEDCAGHMMMRSVVTVRPFHTIGQALSKLRDIGKPLEGYFYVVDADGRLQGTLPLRIAILANSEQKVADVIRDQTGNASVHLTTDREEVADLMQRYHLRAVPVLNDDGKICGQVTWDDAFDVIEAEAEEDMLAIAGTTEDLDSDDGIITKSLQRMPYLILTAIGGFVMAHLIHGDTGSMLQTYPILMAFLPMVPALGGNIGIQCSTVTVRSIATGEIRPGMVWNRTMRELGTGALLGAVLSIVCGIGAYILILLSNEPTWLGLVIGGSLLIAVVIASAFGVFIPLLCQRFNIDPAIAAGPFVTMLNDVAGVLIYLLTAGWMIAWLM